MQRIRLNLESLEDRCMPSASGVIMPDSHLEQDFATVAPVVQQQLQHIINMTDELIKYLPSIYQNFVSQPFTATQSAISIFSMMAWNWTTQQMASFDQLLHKQNAESSSSLDVLSNASSSSNASQHPVDSSSVSSNKGGKHAQSGLSRVWTFGGTSLDTSAWIIDDVINSLNIPNQHQNYSDPNHVIVNNGYLQLLLTQQQGLVGSNPQGIVSTGAMIHTKGTFGYGTYEFSVRMANTASDPLSAGNITSGSLSGLFNYVNNSETEIDMEAYGGWPSYLDVASYKNPDPSQDVTTADKSETYFYVPGLGTQFQDYKFVWTPNNVSLYVNGQYQATLTNNIGSTPANLYVTLFGSDSSTNPASVGTNQYLDVQWIRYTAPGDTPLPVPV